MSREKNLKGLDRTLDSNDVHNVFSNGLDLRYNQIYLNGVDRGYEVAPETNEPGVDFVMATQFTKNINLCNSRNPGKPILVHMSTCGGDWNFGMQIYDAIKACESPITIVNYTHARSMSSIILQAADWRVMMPHSHFMFHQGDYGDYGTLRQVTSGLEFYSREGTPTMLSIYTDSMKKKGEMKTKSRGEIKRWLTEKMNKKEDVFLTAEEAVNYGFADEIFRGWRNYIDQRTMSPIIPKTSIQKRVVKSSGR